MKRIFLGPVGDPRWSRPAMWGVLVAAFILYAWALSGNANEYYAAAVLSGTHSWKAFFFGALDAGSFITVDKPPFALWVMGISARIFGYGTWSMLLPQALAGVAAVGVVFSAVRRSAGHAAALIAAIVMTLTPITVAINRDNNPDTVLVLLLVVAAWCCLEALRTGRLRWLLVCALLVGLGFNTKMLQAYLVVPAFVVAYLVCARVPFVRRLGHVLAAGLVLVVSSAWWMVIVDLWPASSRPYVGGSSDNTVWDLVIGYNGLGRIFGQGGGPGGGGGGASFGGASGADRLFNDTMAGQISWLLPFCAVAMLFAAVHWFLTRRAATVSATAAAYDASLALADGGAQDAPGQEALVLGALAQDASGRGSRGLHAVPSHRRDGESSVRRSPADIDGAQAGASGGALLDASGSAFGGALGGIGAAWLVWGGWLLVHFAVFSFSSGTFHPYYTTAMAPAVAALTGMGGVLMWRAYRESRAWSWVLPLAIALTGAWSFTVLRRTPEFVPWLAWAVLAATVVAVVGLVVARIGRAVALKVAVGALVAALFAGLAGPAAYAVTPLQSQINGTNPTAGPSTGRMGGFGGGMGMMRGEGQRMNGQPPAGFPGQNGQPPTGTDQSGQPPTGSDQSGQPPTVSTDQSGQPPTVSTDQSAQPPTGSTDQSAQPPTGSTDQNGQPPTGSDQSSQYGQPSTGQESAEQDGQRAGQRGGGGPGGGVSDELIAYLEANQGSATWLVAVSSAQSASSIILETGKPAIAMGGFTGSDPAMTVARLQELVSSGQLRYVMAGENQGGPGRGSSEVTTWVQSNCKAVNGQDGLYDCTP